MEFVRSGRGQSPRRVMLDALDHGAQSVRALRRQVLFEAQAAEQASASAAMISRARMAGEEGQRQRDKAAHDMGVAVAEEMQHRLAVRRRA